MGYIFPTPKLNQSQDLFDIIFILYERVFAPLYIIIVIVMYLTLSPEETETPKVIKTPIVAPRQLNTETEKKTELTRKEINDNAIHDCLLSGNCES